jgi:hypothetical protein
MAGQNVPSSVQQELRELEDIWSCIRTTCTDQDAKLNLGNNQSTSAHSTFASMTSTRRSLNATVEANSGVKGSMESIFGRHAPADAGSNAASQSKGRLSSLVRAAMSAFQRKSALLSSAAISTEITSPDNAVSADLIWPSAARGKTRAPPTTKVSTQAAKTQETATVMSGRASLGTIVVDGTDTFGLLIALEVRDDLQRAALRARPVLSVTYLAWLFFLFAFHDIACPLCWKLLERCDCYAEIVAISRTHVGPFHTHTPKSTLLCRPWMVDRASAKT